MSTGKKIGLTFLLLFLAIQLFRPARNTSAAILPADIHNVVAVPPDVEPVLKKACYDCHSNNTIYPWYMNIQPVAWFLANHISGGKKHLNFSEFGTYDAAKQGKKFKQISEEVKRGDMPLTSYTFIHQNAKLSNREKNLIEGWADSLARQH